MTDFAKNLKALGQASEAIQKIEGQVKDSNFDWSLLFPEKKQLHLGWLIGSVITFILFCAVSIYLNTKNQSLFLAVFGACFLCAAWVGVCVHLRFESNTVSLGLAFFLVIITLISNRIITPEQGAMKIMTQISDSAKNEKKQ